MTNEQQSALTEEERLNRAADRLEGVFYQFSEVHKILVAQEQILAKHMGDTGELAKTLTQQVDRLGNLQPALEKAVAEAIKRTVATASQQIDTALQEAVKTRLTETVERLTKPLESSTRRAADTLNDYVQHTIKGEWKLLACVLAMGLAAAVALSFIFVRWLMPTPLLPLSDAMFNTYVHGVKYEYVWPKLSRQEQKRIKAIEATIAPPQTATDDNTTGGS